MSFTESLTALFDALKSGDESNVNAILGDDVNSDALIGSLHGAASMTAFARALQDGFTGGSLSLDRVVEGETTAIAEFSFTGVHDHGFRYGPVNIAPTGRQVRMQGSLVADFAGPNERAITRAQMYWNWLACLAQLGIRPHMRPDPIKGARLRE